MKNMLMIAVLGGLLSVTARAQDRVPPPPETKPDKELECDEADARILKYKEQNQALQTKLDALKADIMKAEEDLAS